MPSLGAYLVGKRRRDLRGSVYGPVCGGGVVPVCVVAGVRCVCVCVHGVWWRPWRRPCYLLGVVGGICSVCVAYFVWGFVTC